MPDVLDENPEPETVFEEPWQAEAFATALLLSRQGAFTWSQWVEVFAAGIASAPQQAFEDVPTAYYRQWLAALETVVAEKFALAPGALAERQEQWRLAYLATPHGHPVALTNAANYVEHKGDDSDHHDRHEHDHHSSTRPIAISAAKGPAVSSS